MTLTPTQKLAIRIVASVLIGLWAWKIYATYGLFLGLGIALVLCL